MFRPSFAIILSALLLGACASNKPAPGSPEAKAQSSQEALRFASDADKAFKRGDFDRCIELNQKALQIDGSLGAVWHNLGVALLNKKEYLAAHEAFSRAAELLPNDPRPYENLGLTHASAGYDTEALKFYALSLERDPFWLPSLRGALVAQKSLLKSDDDGLDRVRRGLYVETEPDWRRLFESERMRIEQDLAEKRKSGKP